MNRKLATLLAGMLALNAAPIAGTPAGAQATGCAAPSERATLPLLPDTSLVRGYRYPSRSGAHSLTFRTDGNLVVDDATGRRLWGLDQVFHAYGRIGCVMIGLDGNLVALTSTGDYLWSALTHASQTDFTANLIVGASGALQLASPGRGVLWSSDGDSTTELDALREAIASCRAGVGLLGANIHADPDDAATAPARRRSWVDVHDEFTTTGLPACRAVGTSLRTYQGLPVLAPTEQAIADSGATGWDDYFDGTFGIVAQADRVTDHCPAQYRTQSDCGLAADGIAGSIAGVQEALMRLGAVECLPAYGWGHCRQMKHPAITIVGATTVSDAAMDLVETVYTEMTARLTAGYPKQALDGYVVYLTNGGEWSEVSQLFPVGTMWLDRTTGENAGDELRGGTSHDYLWIDEQMMCTTGVQTRNDAFEAGTRPTRDDTSRSVDQVVHEFAHAIDFRFDLRRRVATAFASSSNPVEAFPWAVQGKFGAPAAGWDGLTTDQRAFIDEIFGPASHTFTCFA